MRWPLHAVESVRPSRFMPPFCPWPHCIAHRGPGRGFQRNGWYRKPSDPKHILASDAASARGRARGRRSPRPYYLKRPALLISVASGLAACSAHRQIARSNHCAKTSVTRMAERLGRHAILFHARCLRDLPPLGEALVHDHWEVFIGRQDQALGIGTAVGSQSWFVYDLDPAPHRGSGRRPDRKRELERTSGSSRPYVRSLQAYVSGPDSASFCR